MYNAVRQTVGDVRVHDHQPRQESFADALVAGLSGAEKSIPCRFLYDARGSALFEAICRLPEYYLTRAELALLQEHASAIGAQIGAGAALAELGSGAGEKVGLLLDALERPAAYVAIDISRETLLEATARLAQSYPALPVHAVCADYSRAFDLPSVPGSRRWVGYFPGSTIGNFTPARAAAFLSDWRRRLGPGSLMLVGVDLRKPAPVLEAAYDDAAGVTAAFIGNVLVRANREADADFDLSRFAYDARYDAQAGRVSMHLRSTADQVVSVAGRRFVFREGERVHVEDSHKYDIADFQALAREAGYAAEAVWTDREQRFSLHLLAAT